MIPRGQWRLRKISSPHLVHSMYPLKWPFGRFRGGCFSRYLGALAAWTSQASYLSGKLASKVDATLVPTCLLKRHARHQQVPHYWHLGAIKCPNYPDFLKFFHISSRLKNHIKCGNFGEALVGYFWLFVSLNYLSFLQILGNFLLISWLFS